MIAGGTWFATYDATMGSYLGGTRVGESEPNADWAALALEHGPDAGEIVFGQARIGVEGYIEVIRSSSEGEQVWTTGPLRSNPAGVTISAMTTSSERVYLGAGDGDSLSELIILDIQAGAELCAIDLPAVREVSEIIVLDQGEVLLVGESSTLDGWVARYDQDCTELFSVQTQDSGYSGAVLLEGGFIYAVGTLVDDNPEETDAIVRPISLDGQLGAPHVLEHEGGLIGWNAVARAPNGNIILAGYRSGIHQNEGIYLRAEQPLGSLAWEFGPIRGKYTGDHAQQLCLDRAGNTFVVADIYEADWGTWVARFAA